jgi:hypothetical protein
MEPQAELHFYYTPTTPAGAELQIYYTATTPTPKNYYTDAEAFTARTAQSPILG